VVPDAPVSIDIPIGTSAGGETITVEVTDSTDLSAVLIDGLEQNAFTIVDGTHVSCVTLPHVHTPGVQLGVAVVGPYGASPVFVGFTYDFGIDSVTPDHGTQYGGDSVTIIGSGFNRLGDATDVQFQGLSFLGSSPVSASSIVVVSDTEITCVTPDWHDSGTGYASGPAYVSVTRPGPETFTTPDNTLFTFDP
jgi:hypothetical protein